jgi:hypothetical protein
MKLECFAGQIGDLCKWVENLKQKEHGYVEKQKQKSGKCLLKTKEIRE